MKSFITTLFLSSITFSASAYDFPVNQHEWQDKFELSEYNHSATQTIYNGGDYVTIYALVTEGVLPVYLSLYANIPGSTLPIASNSMYAQRNWREMQPCTLTIPDGTKQYWNVSISGDSFSGKIEGVVNYAIPF